MEQRISNAASRDVSSKPEEREEFVRDIATTLQPFCLINQLFMKMMRRNLIVRYGDLVK